MRGEKGHPASIHRKIVSPRAVAANANAPPEFETGGDGLATKVRDGVNDHDLSVPSGAANDNPVTIPVAANDNDISVVDDLPRPLAVLPEEADLIRKLLGERFRQILFGEDQ